MNPESSIPNNNTNQSPSKPPRLPNRRNVNRHDMSAYDLLQAHIHDIDLRKTRMITLWKLPYLSTPIRSHQTHC
jgi:hypothetical protein